ncbi:hypothetical protein ACQUQP_15885 [Marinobacterium sp. YM272]|uniref:hypothetical protein n=1 Tax=Marinobacterium sp. YM272 TaxID=3421654 RepID=UPI003D7FA061
MNEWMNPWWWMLKSPQRSSFDQIVAPITHWWSPRVEFNMAGNEELEAKIVAEVASYGSQLGTLTDAVLELAGDRDSETLQKLRALAEKIDQEKRKYRNTEINALKTALSRLKKEDPDGFASLLAALPPD